MAITKQQFTTLNDLFDYYNGILFDNTLEECLVNMSRHRGAHGFFAWDRWKDKNSDTTAHEISLNPDTMNRADRDWHSTLVHEMCHLWQQTHGNKVRQCYHDKQFAAKMEMVGLMCSNNGMVGGKKTGQSMTHYIIEGGPFEVAFNAIDADSLEALKLPYVPAEPKLRPASIRKPGNEKEGDDVDGLGRGDDGGSEPKKSRSGVKVKYSCKCGNNVWGKPDLKIACLDCESPYLPNEGK